MALSNEMIEDLNRIARWLALDDFLQAKHMMPDMMIVAGHAILPNIFGALTLAKHACLPVLFSGGIGHSTVLLRQAISDNPLTSGIDTEGKSEADLLSDIATTVFGISTDKILLENQSRNCGENADFSRDLLVDRNVAGKDIILVQDPLMQRRTAETFAYSWRKKNMNSRFISWPVFIPALVMVNNKPVISGGQIAGMWSLERYISMILGEVKRLKNDRDGYGPLGAGFIGHVDIPDAIRMAWERLISNPFMAQSVR